MFRWVFRPKTKLYSVYQFIFTGEEYILLYIDHSNILLKTDNKDIGQWVLIVRMSSFLWTSVTVRDSGKKPWDSGKTPCSSDRLIVKLSGVDKILALSLRMVTGILNGRTAFPLFNWDMSLCTSS